MRHKHGHPRLIRSRAGSGGAHLTAERLDARFPRAAILLGAALVVLIGAGFAVALSVPGGSSHQTSPHRAAASTTASATGSTPAAATASTAPAAGGVLGQCQQTWQTVHGVLVAAEPAMRQWQRHITVMNRFVAGQLTPAQANEFWNQTRDRAEHLYAAFSTRDQAAQRSAGSLHCPAPSAASPGSAAALTGCERAVAAALRTLAAARTTLTTWHRHIGAMNKLRAGMLSPTMAQQMWLAAWQAGDAQLQQYQHDARLSTPLTCATEPGG